MALKKWQIENMSRLQHVCNQLGGGTFDGTAVGREKLEKYRKAHSRVSNAIYYTLFDENKEASGREIRNLEILHEWCFPDRNGRISEEELKLNERLQKELNRINGGV